jgi:protein phosphatase
MSYTTATVSRVGPREENEDAVGHWPIPVSARAGVLVAVADGLGGMGGGARASALAIEGLKAFAESEAAGNASALPALFQLIHEDILREQQTSARLARMATTLSAGLFAGDTLTMVHCGDSRIGLARGGETFWLTEDHSEAQRLFNEGVLTERAFAAYPKNRIESALGLQGDPPRIDAFQLDVHAGDRFFFTTDGFYEAVPLEDQAGLAARHADPESFVQAAAALAEARGPSDNFTLAAVYAE